MANAHHNSSPMSRTEELIDEISHLPADQMQRVYQALTRQLHLKDTTEQLLARVSGLAAGLWAIDAQTYVSTLRQDDRD